MKLRGKTCYVIPQDKRHLAKDWGRTVPGASAHTRRAGSLGGAGRSLPTAALRGWVPGVALRTHLACEEAAGRKMDTGTRVNGE